MHVTILTCARMTLPNHLFFSPQDFKDPANEGAAVKCLNAMVTDALRHACDSLVYMQRLKDPQVFRFCAIPQVHRI